MFGFGSARKQATSAGEAAARTALMPLWDRAAGAFDSRIWADPYLLGLIHGSVAAQTLPDVAPKLSHADRGGVLLDVMRNLGAGQFAIEHSIQLGESQDAGFMRGYDNALMTCTIRSGALRQDYYSHPDVAAAIEAAPAAAEIAASMGMPAPRHPSEALALAYIHLKVDAHKQAHYS